MEPWFCTLSENPEGECLVVSLWHQAQAHLGYQQVHLWMAEENNIKVLEWPSQSPDLNPIEMLWHDLKQSIHARKPSDVAELKLFCKEELGQNSSTAMWKTLPVITNAWFQLLLQRVAQPVFRFRGQLPFHVVPGRFGQLFSLNKQNHYFKTAFCIYSGYLCVILKLVWWSESFKWQICKKKKTGRGKKPFHDTVYK